mmetsp:Transcript_9791/g.44585  ORF Transcript_9791/g.44585 Transcript_9791/m.44585 type:complete len:504 (+) Transcript_9791:913-2424(+)
MREVGGAVGGADTAVHASSVNLALPAGSRSDFYQTEFKRIAPGHCQKHTEETPRDECFTSARWRRRTARRSRSWTRRCTRWATVTRPCGRSRRASASAALDSAVGRSLRPPRKRGRSRARSPCARRVSTPRSRRRSRRASRRRRRRRGVRRRSRGARERGERNSGVPVPTWALWGRPRPRRERGRRPRRWTWTSPRRRGSSPPRARPSPSTSSARASRPPPKTTTTISSRPSRRPPSRYPSSSSDASATRSSPRRASERSRSSYRRCRRSSGWRRTSWKSSEPTDAFADPTPTSSTEKFAQSTAPPTHAEPCASSMKLTTAQLYPTEAAQLWSRAGKGWCDWRRRPRECHESSSTSFPPRRVSKPWRASSKSRPRRLPCPRLAAPAWSACACARARCTSPSGYAPPCWGCTPRTGRAWGAWKGFSTAMSCSTELRRNPRPTSAAAALRYQEAPASAREPRRSRRPRRSGRNPSRFPYRASGASETPSRCVCRLGGWKTCRGTN